MEDMRKREKEGKLRHSAINTGGAKGAGKTLGKDKEAKVKTTLDYANKFRVNLPLRDALTHKPNLRGYMANLIAEVAHRQGIPVRLVEGTKVINISETQLDTERRILEGLGIDDEKGALRALESTTSARKEKKGKRPSSSSKRRSDRVSYLLEQAESVVSLLQGVAQELSKGETDGEEDTQDKVFLNKVKGPVAPPQTWD